MRRRGTRFTSLQREIVYGPVESRRLGKSIGINLFPGEKKICTLDCKYCFFPTKSSCPPVDELIRPEDVITALDQFKSPAGTTDSFRSAEAITFSGNGEPTCHPEFPEIAERVAKWIQQNAINCQLILFSNSTNLSKSVVDSFKFFDQVFLKYDWGSQDELVEVSRPLIDVHLDELTDSLATLCRSGNGECGKIVLQAAMYPGSHNEDKWAKWADSVKKIRPQEIHLYELDFRGHDYVPEEHFDFKDVQRAVHDHLRDQSVELEFFYSSSFYVNVDLCYAVDSAIYLPLYIADYAGLFKDRGVRVDHFVSSDGDPGAVDSIVSGKAQFALCDPQAAIDHLARSASIGPQPNDPVLIAVIIDKVALWAISDTTEPPTVRAALIGSPKVITYKPGSTANFLWYWQQNNYPEPLKSVPPDIAAPGEEFRVFCRGLDSLSPRVPSLITADIVGALLCKECPKKKLSVTAYADMKMKECQAFLFTGLLASRDMIDRYPGAVDAVRSGFLEAIEKLRDEAYMSRHWRKVKERLAQAYRRNLPWCFSDCPQQNRKDLEGVITLGKEELEKLDIYSEDGMLRLKSLFNALKVRHRSPRPSPTPGIGSLARWLDKRVAGRTRRLLLSVLGPLVWLFTSNPIRIVIAFVILIVLATSSFVLANVDGMPYPTLCKTAGGVLSSAAAMFLPGLVALVVTFFRGRGGEI